MGDCIFCQIAAGITPADVVYEGEDSMFFRDISPKAPVHVVGITKKHLKSLNELEPGDAAVVGRLLSEIPSVAREVQIAEGGYRVTTNVGRDSGQEVPHLHFHILGGEPLGPLRC